MGSRRSVATGVITLKHEKQKLAATVHTNPKIQAPSFIQSPECLSKALISSFHTSEFPTELDSSPRRSTSSSDLSPFSFGCDRICQTSCND